MKLTRPRLDADLARRLGVRGRLVYARARRTRASWVLSKVLRLVVEQRQREAANAPRWLG